MPIWETGIGGVSQESEIHWAQFDGLVEIYERAESGAHCAPLPEREKSACMVRRVG